MARRGTKGRGRRERKNVRRRQREGAQEREALERRWFRRLRRRPELAREVSAAGVDEPFHRWLPYRQGFSPALVRRFLAEATPQGEQPVLDPFLGSGTTVLECARQGIRAIGIEAIGGLLVIARAALVGAPPLPPLVLPEGELDHALCGKTLEDPLHRAAWLIAAAAERRGDGGRPRRLPPLRARIEEAWERMRLDLAKPPSGKGLLVLGDARRMPVQSASIGAVLTSPPYVSRFDYVRRAGALAAVLTPNARARQVPSTRTARERAPRHIAPHRAAAECAEQLMEAGQPKLAALIERYTIAMDEVVTELARVMRPGAPGWVVIGGAFVGAVYFPADLIVAELAERRGFRVSEIACARHLAHSSGRRLGNLERVLPRESILHLHREP